MKTLNKKNRHLMISQFSVRRRANIWKHYNLYRHW